MAEKDPTITKIYNFLQALCKYFVLVMTYLFELLINFCELVIKVFVTTIILGLVLYIGMLVFGYAAPPEFMNIPGFNVIVI